MRGSKPFLLSTTATLEKFGILDYDFYDFSWDRKKHSNYREDRIKAIVSEVVHMVIVPNGIIAKQSGQYASPHDCQDALEYAMTHGIPEATVSMWKAWKAANIEWMKKAVGRPFRLFCMDTPFDRKTGKYLETRIREKSRYDIRKYVERKITSRRQLASLRWYVHGRSPALNRLVNAYSVDRKMASLKNREIIERYGVSSDTVSKFRKWLSERREKGIPEEFIVHRRKEREHEKDEGDTAGMPGAAAAC